MSWTFAPKQLPLAPRPFPDQVISSWLLRVAAANGVCLGELLNGFASQYPTAFGAARFLDCAIPHAAFEALAQFCRVPVTTLQQLDLQWRAPRPGGRGSTTTLPGHLPVVSETTRTTGQVRLLSPLPQEGSPCPTSAGIGASPG